MTEGSGGIARGALIGLVAGAAAGFAARALLGEGRALDVLVDDVARPVGQIWLRLLFLLVLPLVVSALAVGVAGLGDLRRVGRVGGLTLAYTAVVSAIAVLIGIGLVALLRPGGGIDAEARERLLAGAAENAAAIVPAKPPGTGLDLLVALVPANAVRAAADGDLLAVMVFAALLGVGIAIARSEAARKLLEALEGLYDAGMALVRLVLRLAPIGVGALLFAATAELGLELLGSLARYVAVVLLALALHQFVVYSLVLRTVGGMRPLDFYRAVREPMLTAFSTASSNATLPTALRAAEEELRLPQHVSRFVLTIGSSTNQNGTALFEGMTVLFLAQLYGVDLALGQQVVVVLLCVLGGIGTAGVPAGSLPVVAAILGTVGVPVEGLGLVLGVDRFLDMCRTTLNVTGDLVAAVAIARLEGRASVRGAPD